MLIPTPPRYDYSAIVERPAYDWPGGARLAFYLALNVEQFAFGRGNGHTPHNWSNPLDTRIYAWRDYGTRVGFWNILDLLEELNLPCCHLMNSAVCERMPAIVQQINARGRRWSATAAPTPSAPATISRRMSAASSAR